MSHRPTGRHKEMFPMRSRAALATAALVVAVAGCWTPASASSDSKGSWVANAFPPEPSNGGHCAPKIPQARATHAFVVPGPGVLTMDLNNKLDWSADFRDSKDEPIAESDGPTPNSPEEVSYTFHAKTRITMGACNLTGEPSVTVTWLFHPRKK